MKLYELTKLNQQGFIRYFTREEWLSKNWDNLDEGVPMRFSKAIHKQNSQFMQKEDIEIVDNGNYSGPLKWADSTVPLKKNLCEFDIAMAYPMFLLDYANKNITQVGGHKRFSTTFHNNKYEKFVKYEFNLKTNILETSKFYRHWISETSHYKAKVLKGSNTVAGTILLPMSMELLNDAFLEDIYFYNGYVKRLGYVITTSHNYFTINVDSLLNDINVRRGAEGATVGLFTMDDLKKVMASCTGYLSVADKCLYAQMVNHVKEKMLYIEKVFNTLDVNIHSANTDGYVISYNDNQKQLIDNFKEELLNDFNTIIKEKPIKGELMFTERMTFHE